MCTAHESTTSRIAFVHTCSEHELAQVTFKQPHVLLLDEPSNHLDMDAVDALIEGLNAYKGGVLMVSHDQTLIEATMDELWMCEDNTITVFHGTFEDYKKRLRGR